LEKNEKAAEDDSGGFGVVGNLVLFITSQLLQQIPYFFIVFNFVAGNCFCKAYFNGNGVIRQIIK
jgi:hypothetical protein